MGEFERGVLGLIARMDGAAYGVTLMQAYPDVSIGRIYVTIERLEEGGLIVSRHDGATPERGNRPKRLLTITDAGQLVLRSPS